MTGRELKFFAALKDRRKRNLRCLHILNRDNKYYCLDLSLTTSSLEEMNAAILKFLNEYSDLDILPTMPREWWESLERSKRVGGYKIEPNCDNVRPVLFCEVHA